MSIKVIITFKAKPDKLDDFKLILNSVKTELPTVSGCHAVQIYSDTKEAGVFTLVEHWESEEAHKKHIKNVVDSGVWESLSLHLSCDPQSSYYTEI
jgi:quinol monooxygenase YgiN